MDKYRYAIQHAETKEFLFNVFTINEIEDGLALQYLRTWGRAGYALVSRDRWTGMTVREQIEIYQRDLIKSYHNNETHEVRYGIYWDYDENGGISFYNGFYFYHADSKKGIDRGVPFSLDCNGNTEMYEKVGTIYDQPLPA